MSKIILFLLLFVVAVLSSCNDDIRGRYDDLTLSSFSALSKEEYVLDASLVRDNVCAFAGSGGSVNGVGKFIKDYYSSGSPFIWLTRSGLCERADTLLSALRKAGHYGFDTLKLRVPQIHDDLYRMRTLDFDGESGNVNTVASRLEYNLTRAYFIYTSGVRFGLVNPDYIYNNFEKYEVDSVTERFRRLSDLRVERPGQTFYTEAVRKAFVDSVGGYINSLHPNNDLYALLVGRLSAAHGDSARRAKLLCNLERCRWRVKALPGEHAKYVEVNVPSYSLRAVDGDGVVMMRTICGALDTKTPLLASKITRMDVNPQWIVPKSISKGFCGNYAYMHKMGMFVFDKRKGKLAPEEVSPLKIAQGEQYIIQAGGPKNSLGRIIFRFDNGFSVFLHDTSSPWVFNRANRAASHGCVRVEKPYDLALFLLGDVDEKLKDRLKYSMTVDFINDADSLAKRKIDRKRLINSIPVNEPVPLFITYYTIYYGQGGGLEDYADVYGYDEVLWKSLKLFVK